MLTLYHVPGTRSVRPLWLCNELAIDFQVKTIDFAQSYRDSAQWRAISPAGKVPALTDGALTIFESGAIVEHILDRYAQGRLRPAAGTDARALYNQWCWFSEATLLRPLGLVRILRTSEVDAAQLITDANAKTRDCLKALETALQGRNYLLEEFSAADVMMGYALTLADKAGLLESFPATAAYLARLVGRDAYVRALNA